MSTSHLLWPRTWCAALIGMSLVAGCLDAPQGGDRSSAFDEEEVPGPAAAAPREVCGPSCGVCGNGICETNEIHFCPQDCPLSQCGNGICDGTETALSCPSDCGPTFGFCGDGVCNSSETPASCPGDCDLTPIAVCGDGVCGPGENALNCRIDCPLAPIHVCGDGICSLGETHARCPADCP
jgi:hypothetical protein